MNFIMKNIIFFKKKRKEILMELDIFFAVFRWSSTVLESINLQEIQNLTSSLKMLSSRAEDPGIFNLQDPDPSLFSTDPDRTLYQ